MGLMDKVKKKFHKPTQGEINREQIKTAEELTVLREGVATELDKLTFINTMPACGDPPENFDDEAEYENWKMRSNAREAWSNRLKIYKGMRDHLLKELNEESVTRLNTRKLDRLNEELVEWLGEALKLRDEETADWAFLALDYGICTARKDILHCEETDEENIREKRIDTLGTYKSMVEISRQINDLNKQVQEEEEKMELSDAAIETFGAQIKDLKEKYPLAKEYVEIYGPQNAPTNAPGQRVHVQEIVNAMERYSAAYHNKNAAAGKVALCKSKIAAQKDAIENLRHLLKKGEKEISEETLKRLRSIEETLRHEINAMFQTTKELNEINKRTSKVVEEYFQSPEFIKEQNKAIDEYEEIQDGIKQEEEAENRAMANKLKQEAERIKQQAAKNENKRLTNTN